MRHRAALAEDRAVIRCYHDRESLRATNAFSIANSGEWTNQLRMSERNAASVPAISFRMTLLERPCARMSRKLNTKVTNWLSK